MAHAIVIFFKEDFLRKDFFLNSDLVKTKELLRDAAYGIKMEMPNESFLSLFTRIPEAIGLVLKPLPINLKILISLLFKTSTFSLG